jgi:hypothetical protein
MLHNKQAAEIKTPQTEWVNSWMESYTKTSIDMQYIYRRWKGQWIYYDNNQPALCGRALLMYVLPHIWLKSIRAFSIYSPTDTQVSITFNWIWQLILDQ